MESTPTPTPSLGSLIGTYTGSFVNITNPSATVTGAVTVVDSGMSDASGAWAIISGTTEQVGLQAETIQGRVYSNGIAMFHVQFPGDTAYYAYTGTFTPTNTGLMGQFGEQIFSNGLGLQVGTPTLVWMRKS